MRVATFEGYVEEGRIRLTGKAELPEKARVYVVFPDLEASPQSGFHVASPRLARPSEAALFVKEVAEDV